MNKKSLISYCIDLVNAQGLDMQFLGDLLLLGVIKNIYETDSPKEINSAWEYMKNHLTGETKKQVKTAVEKRINYLKENQESNLGDFLSSKEEKWIMYIDYGTDLNLRISKISNSFDLSLIERFDCFAIAKSREALLQSIKIGTLSEEQKKEINLEEPIEVFFPPDVKVSGNYVQELLLGKQEYSVITTESNAFFFFLQIEDSPWRIGKTLKN